MIESISYSPDGGRLASCSRDGRIRIWDINLLLNKPQHGKASIPIPKVADPSGWVHDANGGLVFWVPEDCRSSLNHPYMTNIPDVAHQRVIQLEFTEFQYGSSWAEVKRAR